MRLDKFLSNAGVTRSRAKDAVKRGEVSVDGVTALDPSAHISESSRVLFKGVEIRETGHCHIMLNKPSGVVTAQSDGMFKTVFDVLPRDMLKRGLSAVGRLDRDTTGLLLFTTDGELAHRLISPNREVEKVYLAKLDEIIDETCVMRMAEGVKLKDFNAKPAKMRIIDEHTAELTVTEGKYHQVKRMFAALGKKVVELKRLSIAGVGLDANLESGQARYLEKCEADALYTAVGLGGDEK